jgi:hypothetical protein
MQISDKQLAANRANAAKSTGPKSPAIRRNAATFENLANAILIEGESRPRFIELLHSVYAEFLPETPSERALVEKLGVYQWLHLRTLTLQSAAIAHEMRRRSESAPDEPPLTRAIHAARSIDERSGRSEFGRAASRLDRQYHRTLEALHRIQALHRIKALQRIKERKTKKNIRPQTTQVAENKESASEIESHETH